MSQNLAEKIGELTGQLRLAIPILEDLQKRIHSLEGDRTHAKTSLDQLKLAFERLEIQLAKAAAKSSARWWEIAKLVVAALLGAGVSYFLKK